jgi:hypothetical protein
MPTRKKEQTQLSRLAGFYSMAEERVAAARKAFEKAHTTLSNARTYGTEAHVAAAASVLTEAAENYAEALRTCAHVVIDYAGELRD